MADISKIILPDGSEYNVKDSVARASIPAASTANPEMDGTASPGSSTAWARGDHVHPSDTSKAPKSHASVGSTYGVGSGSLYGHVKLSSEIYDTQGENDGTAATPAAVKQVYTVTSNLPEAQIIAPVVTNNTTSQAFAVGDYFARRISNAVGTTPVYSWELYRVTAAISSGGTVTPGTNCEVVTVGGELNKKPGYELLAPLETSTTASRAYTYGERFVYNGVLYQAIAPIASGGTITPGTNCQDATNIEARFKTYSYTANGTYTVTLARNSRRYLVIADRLGRAAVLVNYIAYNGNTPFMVTIADIDSANRGISLSISGATLTITVSATYAIVKIMEV